LICFCDTGRDASESFPVINSADSQTFVPESADDAVYDQYTHTVEMNKFCNLGSHAGGGGRFGFQRFTDPDGRYESRFLAFDAAERGAETVVQHKQRWATFLADAATAKLPLSQSLTELLHGGVPQMFRFGWPKIFYLPGIL
jgi:hypothetical protein